MNPSQTPRLDVAITGRRDGGPIASLPAAQHRLRVSPRAQSHPELEVVVYDSGTPERPEAPPLVLVHSVNAIASAFEMEPVFLRQARRRRVVALDLPGFGASDKPDIDYTPTLMRDAVIATLDWVGQGTTGRAGLVDLMALSLGCEFAAEAVLQRTGRVRSVAFISPTGMEARREDEIHAGGHTREAPWLRRVLRGSAVGGGLFKLLSTRAAAHWHLGRAWGEGSFDPRLLEHGQRLAAQPGAERAPLDFVSGALFTRGIIERYRMLALPLWVCHGQQGPFTDVGACPARTGSAALGGSHAVRRAAFDTGALPHFSMPTPFEDAYLRFMDGLGRSRPAPRVAAAMPSRVLLSLP